MMTASSVGFYPCQVQLIGLPRRQQQPTSQTSAAVDATASIVAEQQRAANRVRPLPQSAKRNLFGAPDRKEMHDMFKRDNDLRRQNFQNRYHIVEEQLPPRQMPELPSLIVKELQAHEQRLEQEKCNLNGVELTPMQKESNTTTSTNCNNIERHRPYARQTLITDRFAIRKNLQCVNVSSTRNATTTTVANGKLHALIKSSSASLTTESRPEVLELPKSMRAKISSSSDAVKINSSTTLSLPAANNSTQVSSSQHAEKPSTASL